MGNLPKVIYVLDDDESFLSAVLRLLRLCGIDARPARSLADLRTAFPLAAGACVLADIVLAGESGLSVAALLADHGQVAPIVFVSAVEDEDTLRVANRLAGGRTLKKPVEADDLLAALCSAM